MPRFARLLVFAIASAFAVACAFALRGDLARMSMAPVARSWDLVLLAAALSLGNYGLRIVRWRLYLARLGHLLPAGFVALTYVAGFAFTVSPGKLGEMARARYYSRVGIRIPDTAGAFFVERLMDVVAMVLLATLVLAAAPRYQPVFWAAGAIAALVVVLLAALPWPEIATWARATPRLPRALAGAFLGVSNTLTAARALLTPGVLLSGLCLALAAWALEGLGLHVLGLIFRPAHGGVAVGVGIYAMAVLVGAVSFLPGGLGTTEAAMIALLAAQGYRVADAVLVTVLCRLVTLWLAVGMGWIAVLFLRQRTLGTVVPW